MRQHWIARVMDDEIHLADNMLWHLRPAPDAYDYQQVGPGKPRRHKGDNA